MSSATYKDDRASDPRQEFLSEQMRVLDRYALQDSLVSTLEKTKFRHLVPRVADCHRGFDHWTCDHEHHWCEAKKSCNTRLCPHCQRIRSSKVTHRWGEHLATRGDLRYIVLAERNSENLTEGIASLYDAWARLRGSDLWKSAAKGAIVVLEVTRNKEAGTWHPHLNVIFSGDYIPFERLLLEWRLATQDRGQTARISKADAETVRELVKYVTKLSDFVDDPTAVEEFLQSTARRRFIRTYGEFYGLALEDLDSAKKCPDCESENTVNLGTIPPHQMSLDFAGKFRPLPRAWGHRSVRVGEWVRAPERDVGAAAFRAMCAAMEVRSCSVPIANES